MTWKCPVLALLLSFGCSSSESGGQPLTDASQDGAGALSGGTGGKAGTGGGTAGKGGGNTGGGAAGSSGAGGRGGSTGGAGGGGGVGMQDGSIADATADSRESGPTSCRGVAAAFCPTGEWQKYAANGSASCAACPGPTPTCTEFDLAASTFTAGATHRIIRMAWSPGAAEVLLDDDIRVTPTFEGTSCGGSLTVTTFGKLQILVEHDGAGRTFLSVDIGLINTTMVPCGDIRLIFNDGCCTHHEVHVSAVYDEGSGTTRFSCKDGG
jgi:hypothetical protein